MRRATRALLPRGPVPAPGVRLPVAAALEVRQALGRRRAETVVVRFSREDGVEVLDREVLASYYRRAGVRELVQRLRGAQVPPGYVLGLLDADEGARCVLLPLEQLLAAAELVDEGAPVACGTYAGGE